MIYYSQYIGREVVDLNGKVLGKVHDIGVDIRRKLPPSRSLTIIRTKRGKRSLLTIPWNEVRDISGNKRIVLSQALEDLKEAGESTAVLHLGKHLLDRQIVDLNGRKVVRVNDLILAEFDSTLVLTGVDISGTAILRRLGLRKPMERLLDLLGFDMREKTIAWDYVAPIEIQPEGIKLRIARTQLRSLHPSDIADILEQLDPGSRSRAIDLMDNLMAAESISEVESFQQADIMSELSEVRASDILEAMPPDEATDVLGLLPRDKAERLLNIMGVQEASVIRELLGYEEHSAGGRMTPEFIAVTSGYDALRCIEYLREQGPSAETIYYLYILDNEERLKGVASLRDLLMQGSDTPVEQFMEMDVISVNVNDDQEVVADLMNKYDFLALPVVDDDNHLKGIITVDDMIDVLREESREDISQITGLAEAENGILGSLRMRAPVFLLTLVGGSTVALALYAFRDTLEAITPVIFFLPILLRGIHDIGVLSQTIILDAVGGREVGLRAAVLLTLKELRTTFFLGAILATASFCVAMWWADDLGLGLVVSLSILISLILSATVTSLLVLWLSRVRNRPLLYFQTRLIGFVVTFFCLLVYLGLADLIPPS
jgi:magnesium transporter